MNIETHKTIAITAVMETDLITYINVPIEVTDEQLWEFVNDDNICGGMMEEQTDFGHGDWRWQEPYEVKFDEDAEDYSDEFKN